MVPETLFQPSILGYDINGLDNNIWLSLKRCSSDIQKDLCANIVLVYFSEKKYVLPFYLFLLLERRVNYDSWYRGATKERALYTSAFIFKKQCDSSIQQTVLSLDWWVYLSIVIYIS
jgi:hypothetical protein